MSLLGVLTTGTSNLGLFVEGGEVQLNILLHDTVVAACLKPSFLKFRNPLANNCIEFARDSELSQESLCCLSFASAQLHAYSDILIVS